MTTAERLAAWVSPFPGPTAASVWPTAGAWASWADAAAPAARAEMPLLGPGLQALDPQVGDVVRFGHPASSYSWYPHRFYDDFPYGREIGPEEDFVDVRRDVRVLEVARASSLACPPDQKRADRQAARGLTAGTRAPVDVYVAIRFVSRHGTSLWTNWSKNIVQWMHLARDAAFDWQ